MPIEYAYREPVARCARSLLMKTPSKTPLLPARSRAPAAQFPVAGSPLSQSRDSATTVPLLPSFARLSLFHLVVCLLQNPAFSQYASNTVSARLHRGFLMFRQLLPHRAVDTLSTDHAGHRHVHVLVCAVSATLLTVCFLSL